MKESIMELRIWSGDQNIPSVDFESLQVWAYARISGVPVKVQVSGNALWTPKGSLPVLKHGNKYYCSFSEVSDLFSSMGVNPDQPLPDTVKSDITAYTALLKERLYPAIQYTWWLDRKNFENVSRPTFAKASTWPLNFYYPGHFERKAVELLEALFSSVQDLDFIAAEVYANAQICLNSLSTILGNKKYFFGDNLTSFDATLYAYLCPTLNKDFPNKKLESHIRGCSNLVKYVDRITKELFPESYSESGNSSRQDQTTVHGRAPRTLSKRNHMILSALIAFTSVSSFAYFTGIIDFGKKPAEDEEGNNENQTSGSFYENLYS